MQNRRQIMQALAALPLAGAAGRVFAQQGEKVLRVVPTADLKILDPIWTTAFITRDHGYCVYDTLYGMDNAGNFKPQMVDKHAISADGLSWTFTLRKGLAFHDDKPVTAADVIASLKRWGQRDSLGQRMFAAMDKIEAVDANSFRMVFKTPFGMVIEALGKPSAYPAFIMPARVAATPPNQQISDTTGSGPFIFKKDEYRPGEKVVYVKNTKYVPRSEAPDATTGGKHVLVDRMEWLILKDAQTQVNAIAVGDVDMIEEVPSTQYLALKSNDKVALERMHSGSFAMHLNHLVAPFDNPLIAQAALLAVNQEALLRAQVVHKELYRTNPSIYPLGSVYASDKTDYFNGMPQFAKAKALLKEAGYDGKPVVLLYPSDSSSLGKFPPVMGALLKQAGFSVDMQSMDWPTLVSRRSQMEAADKGGWNIFITGWSSADNINPMFIAPLTGNGTKGWFGWTTDDKLEELKGQFLTTADAAARKDLATRIQQQVFKTGIYAPLGELDVLSAYRKGVLSGLLKSPVNVYWNIKKAAA